MDRASVGVGERAGEAVMDEWIWNGARWWKFDFHSHTPKSDDYGKGPEQEALKRRTPEEWLLDYMRAGIDCVAVTDHNTGAWIDELKEALQGLESAGHTDVRELHLFPGVELSVNGGVHLLAIFDPGENATTSSRSSSTSRRTTWTIS
jgi:predicted metal-dependent phosphoesterase TrpH